MGVTTPQDYLLKREFHKHPEISSFLRLTTQNKRQIPENQDSRGIS